MNKKSALIAIVCVCFILVLISAQSIKIEAPNVTPPKKPLSIPQEAFWVGGIDGGNFIIIHNIGNNNLNIQTEIYNDFTGDLEYSGMLYYSGKHDEINSFYDRAIYQGWDGEKLHLSNGNYLSENK